MGILGHSSLVLSVAAFSLGLTALARNYRNRLVRSYVAVCVLVFVQSIAFFLEKLFDTGTFYRLHLTASVWLPVLASQFVMVLTRVDGKGLRWYRRVFSILAVLVTVFLWGGITYLEFLASKVACFIPFGLSFHLFHLMRIDYQIKKGGAFLQKRSTVGINRRNYIYFGALFLVFFTSFDHFKWLGFILPSLSNLGLCLYLFVVSEAIIHQRLFHFTGLLNRVLSVVFVCACLALIFTLFVAWVDNSASIYLLNAFLASFVILMLIEPMRRLIDHLVLRIFGERYLVYERVVASAEHSLTGVLDSSGLADISIQFLRQTLGCESASVFFLRSDASKFRRVRGFQDSEMLNREILVRHPVVEFFQKMRRIGDVPVVLDHYLENEIDRTTSPAQRDNFESVLKGLRGLNANIAIPFFVDTTVLGFVALRSASPPEAWGNNWGVLSVIYPFFKQAARVLNNMDVYVRLREKDRLAALGEMAAGLAHEIRNPLGAIKGAAQYLLDAPQEKQKEFLRVIAEEADRLNGVVSRFLDYSRPWKAELRAESILGILQKTLMLFEQSIPTDVKISLIEPKQEGLLPDVICSSEMLRQVLVNLIQNSIGSVTSSSGIESPAIQIGARVAKTPQSKSREIEIYVIDNGMGIPRENIDKIFIPFFTTSPKGTGLGLSICAKIIEAHSGRIEVVSDERKETRFSIYLPTKTGDVK